MTQIFDAHSHCFTPIGIDDGNLEQRLQEIQYHIRLGGMGLRRRHDHSVLENPAQILCAGDGISWLTDVDFRIGTFGRVEFTHHGEDYYLHLVPPHSHDLSAKPDYITAEMDSAGVSRAVLQHDGIYGRLDDYLAECVARYPDRFVALAQVDEWRGGQPDQLHRVRHQIQDLGHSGLYFSTIGFFFVDFRFGINDSELDPLWELVGELGIPVHWYAASLRLPALETYLVEISEFAEWARRHPEIPSVLTHGLDNLRKGIDRPDRFTVPREILDYLQYPNSYLELMLHKMVWDHEFPPYHPEIPKLVETLVSNVGSEKLVWGSDMPSCNEVVTYSQSLILFQTQCPFLTPKQRAGILGENLARLYPPHSNH